MFEQQWNLFLERQQRDAAGARLERLQRDLTGEKKLVATLFWPVLKSLDELTLEYSISSQTGVTIYGDVYFRRLNAIVETEGFVSHAEQVTRDRFTFERMRVRSFVMQGYLYLPFSWDELDKKPDACRRVLYELLGRSSLGRAPGEVDLSAGERELVYWMRLHGKELSLAEACMRLGRTAKPTRHVLRKLLGKQLISPVNQGTLRIHKYALTEKGKKMSL
ncbi:hypothetical protein [Paenibacillus koleovorans]|uniref:hypothetical protein n=1 Tax=Paenibacillus koleovorans TaxID=121608 RepID=UPI000FDA5267|nr:hypothetical protein [Paenibacillus koleovorans]